VISVLADARSQAILAELADGRPRTPQELEAAFEAPWDAIQPHVRRLVVLGAVRRLRHRRGYRYRIGDLEMTPSGIADRQFT